MHTKLSRSKSSFLRTHTATKVDVHNYLSQWETLVAKSFHVRKNTLYKSKSATDGLENKPPVHMKYKTEKCFRLELDFR